MIHATEEISKGEEITIEYKDNMTNLDMFLVYGFVYQPNINDVVIIKIMADHLEK